MAEFLEATAIAQTGPDEFTGTVDERFWILRAPLGGYLAGMMLRALEHRIADPARAVRSFTTHFAAPPKPGPITIRTNVERTGRRLTMVSCRAEQHDALICVCLAAFSEPWVGLEFDHAPMPETVPPEQGFRVPVDENSPPFLRTMQISATLGDPPFSGSDRALMGGWLRLAQPVVADAPVVSAYMDAFAPVVWTVATKMVFAPTVDLTVHFREPLPLAGAAPEDWYFARFRSSLARQGFFEEDGELWSADGRLLAQSRQLALALLPD